MSQNFQVFGGPYYYFKKDATNSNIIESLVTLAIMGDRATNHFIVSERHFANGNRVHASAVDTQTLDRAMGEMGKNSEALVSKGYKQCLDTQDPNFFQAMIKKTTAVAAPKALVMLPLA